MTRWLKAILFFMEETMKLNIVLLEPEIPQNTGNIARTCAAIDARLHLIKPLGFSVEDKYLKRAGLDYWGDVEIIYHDNFDDFCGKYKDARFFFASTKSEKTYCDIEYKNEDFIIFGKETAGLPESLLKENWDYCIRIPIKEHLRSLNLSNAAAIIAYEAMRQWGFPGLSEVGKGVNL